ncbi:MAG: NCS2 family permease [Marinifilaceae bacterium]
MLLKSLGFDPKTMSLKREVSAGLTTFLTMSYILAVNPDILSVTGMDKGALFTATALASAIATLLLAFIAKLPFAQAPAMGINAFFAFTLVQAMGYSWETALTVILIEGILFVLLTLFGIREKIVNSIPLVLRNAISVAIGLFIAFIGLKNAGIIVAHPATLVGLGSFTPIASLAMIGVVLSGVLIARKVKGALFYSILLCTVIGIPMGVTQLPENFMPVSMPSSLSPIFFKFDFSQIFSLEMFVIIFSLVFMDLFNTLGTLIGAANKADMVDKQGNIPHLKEALLADALGTTAGAMLGTSTVTTYVESAAGIAEGGRSGVTAATTGVLFLLALFFSPIFLLVPSAATTGALVIVGVFMMDSILKIDFSDITDALPAFVTIIMMPLTYSIADGIVFGLLTYVLVKLISGKKDALSPAMIILAILFALQYIF